MKGKILIVEDDHDFSELLTEFLLHNNYEVSQAVNGKKALDLINLNGYPDLILTDLIMDEMEGIELISTLRKKKSLARIIAMSGGGRVDADNYLKIVKTLGAVGVLKKPFKLDELLKMVEMNI